MTVPIGVPFSTLVQQSGRAWWEVKYMGGDTVGEWETGGVADRLAYPRLSLHARSNWQDLDHYRIVGARLWCPNGQVAEVQAPGPYRTFQFKAGHATSEGESITDAQVLGVIIDDEGWCHAWEWSDAHGLASIKDRIQELHERYGVGPF